jgi:zinc/manganese transport system substrate-binding protein
MIAAVRRTAGAAVLLALVVLSACGDGEAKPRASGSSCPTPVVPVVVTVDQWGDIVQQLVGDCGAVTTILQSSSVDPHDYEPAPADYAAFSSAELVVQNGLDYDAWADQAVEAMSRAPAVIDAGDVVGLREGANPHLWYGPAYVDQVATAVTAELGRLRPAASAYFDERHAAWEVSLQPYEAAIARVKREAGRATYGATESVFAYMADALGLVDVTPAGYRNAVANESEPGPADVHAFLESIDGRRLDVLVNNTQTEGPAPEQLRAAAEHHRVPVVDVTETVAPGAAGFVDWQVGQLTALAEALGR